MKRQGQRPRWLACVLTAALAASSGCVCLCPVAPVSDDAAARSAALPPVCRSHVYVFLVNGERPFDLANLNGVRDALLAQGYVKTYRGEWYHTGYFKDEILRLRRDDESARFVVMGFCQGANAARDLTEAVGRHGVTVDLLVLCGGADLLRGLCPRPACPPANALRVLQLLPDGAAGPDDDEVIRYDDGGPFAASGQGYPMEALIRELTEVASRVRVVDLRPAAELLPPERAPPHVAESRETMPRDDWDFLKPTLPAPRVLPPQPPMPKAP